MAGSPGSKNWLHRRSGALLLPIACSSLLLLVVATAWFLPGVSTGLLMAVASWATYALLLYGICALVRMPRGWALAASALAPCLALLALQSPAQGGFFDVGPSVAWWLPGASLVTFVTDARIGTQQDGEALECKRLDFFGANAKCGLHFADATFALDGSAFLTFKRNEKAGCKLVRLAPDWTVQRDSWVARLSPDCDPYSFSFDEARKVAVVERGIEALYSVHPENPTVLTRLMAGPEPMTSIPGFCDRSAAEAVAPLPGQGFVCAEKATSSFVGRSLTDGRLFAAPREAILPRATALAFLQALPDRRFVAVGWSSFTQYLVVTFDADGRVLARAAPQPSLAPRGLNPRLVAFGDGSLWSLPAAESASEADVSIFPEGEKSNEVARKIRSHFPFAQMAKKGDADVRWTAVPMPNGDVAVAFAEPVPRPLQPDHVVLADRHWPLGPIAHFSLVEFRSDGEVVRQQKIF